MASLPPKKRKLPLKKRETMRHPSPPMTRSAAIGTSFRSTKRLTRSVARDYGASLLSGLGLQLHTGKRSKRRPRRRQRQHPPEQPKITIIIEHCTQRGSFRTRATEVKEGLEAKIPDINVILNPVQPRRGCFEIRREGGETFISFLNMKHPFKPMRDLDVDEVILDINNKINGQNINR